MSDILKFTLSLVAAATIGLVIGYFTFHKTAPAPNEVYKTKDSLIYITDSAECKDVIEILQTELDNCYNENNVLSAQYLKLKKQVNIIVEDSVKNAEDYNYIKEYKKENNLK